jgi:hypothetical protein
MSKSRKRRRKQPIPEATPAFSRWVHLFAMERFGPYGKSKAVAWIKTEQGYWEYNEWVAQFPPAVIRAELDRYAANTGERVYLVRVTDADGTRVNILDAYTVDHFDEDDGYSMRTDPRYVGKFEVIA